MSEAPADVLLDLRGLRCPWPALRVARALREAAEGATLLVVADDPAASTEIAAVVAARGWCSSVEPNAIGPALRVRR